LVDLDLDLDLDLESDDLDLERAIDTSLSLDGLFGDAVNDLGVRERPLPPSAIVCGEDFGEKVNGQ
jgi:hypothetical protein